MQAAINIILDDANMELNFPFLIHLCDAE